MFGVGHSEQDMRLYAELSEVRHSSLERPTPNISTIQGPASCKILLQLQQWETLGGQNF